MRYFLGTSMFLMIYFGQPRYPQNLVVHVENHILISE
jgi:hypothetical protein